MSIIIFDFLIPKIHFYFNILKLQYFFRVNSYLFCFFVNEWHSLDEFRMINNHMFIQTKNKIFPHYVINIKNNACI